MFLVVNCYSMLQFQFVVFCPFAIRESRLIYKTSGKIRREVQWCVVTIICKFVSIYK